MDDAQEKAERAAQDAQLAATAHELGTKVERLTDAVKSLDVRTGTVERRSARLAIAAVLAVAVLVIGGWLAFTQSVTNGRLNEVIAAQDAQRAEVNCPIVALLLGGYDPESRSPGIARDRYEATFEEYRLIYTAQGCASPLVPPRTAG